MKLLLDTNAIIDQLKSGLLDFLSESDTVFISAITEAELLRYPGLSDKELTIIEDIIFATIIVNVDSVIARRAALLGRSRKTKLPDLLIAATAIELQIPLYTQNLKDFKTIPDLKLFNPSLWK